MGTGDRKSDSAACVWIFTLAIFASGIYLVYTTIQKLQNHREVVKLIEGLKGLGLCLGILVLGFALIVLYIYLFGGDNKPKLTLLSEIYPVRCYPEEIDTTAITQVPGTPSELVGEKSIYPVFLLLSISNFGISLATIPPQSPWDWINADNETRFHAMNQDHPGSIILSSGYCHLYYTEDPQNCDMKLEVNPRCEYGYSGPLPAELGGNLVEIVIVYSAIVEENKLYQYYQRKQPQKLKLAVIDQAGHDDHAATRKLYAEIYEALNPPPNPEYDYPY